MNFCEFVAISQNQVAEASMDFKSRASFLHIAKRYPSLPVADQLGAWIAAMIDKGTAASTRKRYVEKLSTLYKDFNANAQTADNTDNSDKTDDPFALVRPLRDLELTSGGKDIYEQCRLLDNVFTVVMNDAKSNPPVALFLYMLFNASADIEKAISLRTDEYVPVFPQLEKIIDPLSFHHRRRYVFDLNQTRKRMPQLVREVLKEIRGYLSLRRIKFSDPFSPVTFVALWTAKARESGVTLSDLRAMLDVVPSEFGYLNYIKGSPLSESAKMSIKKNVAEAFWPTDDRWYAMKLRRGASFDEVKKLLGMDKPDDTPETSLFYPMRTVVKKAGRKMVKDQIPYIEDVVFIQTRKDIVSKIDRAIRHEGYGWMFRQSANPGSDYSIIDKAAMKAFQRAVGEYTPDIKVELTSDKPVGIGRKVRIAGGAFSGYSGIIYDVADKEGDESRRIFIRLSEEYGIKVDIKIEDYLVEPINE